jgi:hypothetical protein
LKYINTYLSLATLIILIGYIFYDHAEVEKETPARITVAEPDWNFPGGAKSFDLPDTISFAGERVPLEIPDVRERLDREIHINTYWHNNTIFMIKRANRWLPQIEKILREENIPDDFKYIAVIESGLINDISEKNAVGFWQFLKGTAKDFGLTVNRDVDERYDPIKSTRAACKYFKQAYDKFNNWTLVSASYDRGMRGMQNAMDNQKVDSYYDLLLNEETSRYIFRVLALKEILSNPAKYGFQVKDIHLYEPEPTKTILVSEDIPDLIEFARTQGINYKILKRLNPWLIRDQLSVSRGESFEIAIPATN